MSLDLSHFSTGDLFTFAAAHPEYFVEQGKEGASEVPAPEVRLDPSLDVAGGWPTYGEDDFHGSNPD